MFCCDSFPFLILYHSSFCCFVRNFLDFYNFLLSSSHFYKSTSERDFLNLYSEYRVIDYTLCSKYTSLYISIKSHRFICIVRNRVLVGVSAFDFIFNCFFPFFSLLFNKKHFLFFVRYFPPIKEVHPFTNFFSRISFLFSL